MRALLAWSSVIFACAPAQRGTGPRAAGAVCLAISVDWEGAQIIEEDVAAIERLQRALPRVVLTHFLNAAYLTKPRTEASRIRTALERIVRPNDERGLHVHAWRSLITEAGVSFREAPSFLGEIGFTIDDEAGFDVELETYEVHELETVVKRSIALLASLDPQYRPRSFRAGGFIAGPRVLEAVRRSGLAIDSSATDASWYDELPVLASRIRSYWPDVRPETQPHELSTLAGPLIEVPLSGGMADFLTPAELAGHLQSAIRRRERSGEMEVAQIGFHQEGAADYAGRIVEAFFMLSQEEHESMVLDTVSGCAARWQRD